MEREKLFPAPNTLHAVEGVAQLYPQKISKGDVHISRFFFKDETGLANLRAVRDGGYMFYCNEGYEYVRLRMNGKLMMSDTPLERISNKEFIDKANGKVLIAGLGLGLVIHNILKKEEVTQITVVENNPDLIELVKPLFKDKRVFIIEADIYDFEFVKGEKWDCIYFDIWPTIDVDNLAEIKVLHNKFKHRLNRENPNCYMDSWLKKYLQNMKRKESRQSFWY